MLSLTSDAKCPSTDRHLRAAAPDGSAQSPMESQHARLLPARATENHDRLKQVQNDGCHRLPQGKKGGGHCFGVSCFEWEVVISATLNSTHHLSESRERRNAVTTKKSVTRILAILRFLYHQIEHSHLHLPTTPFVKIRINRWVISIFNFREKRNCFTVSLTASKKSVATNPAIKKACLQRSGRCEKQEKRNWVVALFLPFTTPAPTHLRFFASQASAYDLAGF